MITHLIIVDPNIIDFNGHYTEYSKAICEAAKKKGLALRVLANIHVSGEVKQSLNALPVFQHDFWYSFCEIPKVGFFLDTLMANLSFYKNLKTGLKEDLNPQTIIFMPTVNHRQILALTWWISRIPRFVSMELVLLLRYSYYNPGNKRHWSHSALWIRLGLFLLKYSAYLRGVSLRLATDSVCLKKEYKQLTPLPIEVFPIPHTGDLPSQDKNYKARQTKTIRFVSLGDARREKGFDLIAQAIQRLHKREQIKGMEFLLQCHVSDEAHLPMKAYCHQLEDLNATNVRLIKGVLPRNDYARLLMQSDVVLLPYSKEVYLSRTSGPFTEALAAAKPVIVTDGTWMSDQLRSYGSGLRVIDRDAESLMEAMIQAVGQYKNLHAKAQHERSRWLSFHNSERFFDMLTGGGDC